MVHKMKITRDLWIRLNSKQFSFLPEVKTYSGMHSLCLSMRFRKIPFEEQVLSWHKKLRFSWNFEISWNVLRSFWEGSGMSSEHLWMLPRILAWSSVSESHLQKRCRKHFFMKFMTFSWFCCFIDTNVVVRSGRNMYCGREISREREREK